MKVLSARFRILVGIPRDSTPVTTTHDDDVSLTPACRVMYVLPPRFDNYEWKRELLAYDDGGGGDVLLSYHCFAGDAVMLFLILLPLSVMVMMCGGVDDDDE